MLLQVAHHPKFQRMQTGDVAAIVQVELVRPVGVVELQQIASSSLWCGSLLEHEDAEVGVIRRQAVPN